MLEGKDNVETSLFNTLFDTWPNLACQTPTDTLFTTGNSVKDLGRAG